MQPGASGIRTRTELPGPGGPVVAVAVLHEGPGAEIVDDMGGSWICAAPDDPLVPTHWYHLTVPAGVTAVEIDAAGGGALLGPVERPAFGTRVRATVPARPGERILVRTSRFADADGGSEVMFTSNWADRWVFASGGGHRTASWAPVGAIVEERVHGGPGGVTLHWRSAGGR